MVKGGGALGRRERDTLRRLRTQCLALPETTEADSWGHPNFRAGKRTFVSFEWIRGRPSIAFRLDPADVDRLSGLGEFFVTPYGQGRWVSAWADRKLDWKHVERLILQSYRVVALKRMVAILDRTKKSP